jgi:hypothetical protein
MSTPTNWTCPNCRCYNPAELKVCLCGAKPNVPAGPASPRRRLPTWIAALPALIAPTFYAVNAGRQFHNVSQAIGSNQASQAKQASGCVDTYSITLSNSHEYVRSFGGSSFPVASRDPSAPRELATVLRGNVINNCGEPLKNVHLQIVVHDDKGSRGTGTIQIDELKPGISQQFERAWMAAVATWEITSDK